MFAAVALFIGGVPVVWFVMPVGLFGLTRFLLTIAWIISGCASVYLLYRWYKNKQMIFGRKKPLEQVLFLIAAITGINLGIAGLFGQNIGMTIFNSHGLFILMGLADIATAWYLYARWKEAGEKLFS